MANYIKLSVLRQQFAVGVETTLTSERALLDGNIQDLGQPVLRIFDGKRRYEFNVLAAVIWMALDHASDLADIENRLFETYPSLAPKIIPDLPKFIETCCKDGLITVTN